MGGNMKENLPRRWLPSELDEMFVIFKSQNEGEVMNVRFTQTTRTVAFLCVLISTTFACSDSGGALS